MVSKQKTPVPFFLAIAAWQECFLGDALGSTRCQCGPQLRSFIETVLGSSCHPCGILLQTGLLKDELCQKSRCSVHVYERVWYRYKYIGNYTHIIYI